MTQATVFITGGSGAVGSAMVRRFTRDGYAVAFTWHQHGERAATLAAETGALALQADLTQPAAVQAVVAAALQKLGSIDVLVNNAGRTQVMPFALLEAEDWDDILGANLKTMFLVTREVARGMVARKSGVIINIGSLAGHRMLEVPVHYATAKAGVMGFTLSLAREFARFHIRVNAVVPGLLTEGVGRMVPEKEMAEYTHYCTAGRAGTPEEVAGVVRFLAGADAGYVNGQMLFVDGGL